MLVWCTSFPGNFWSHNHGISCQQGSYSLRRFILMLFSVLAHVLVQGHPYTTWAAMGTRLWFWDPLSLLATLIAYIECHTFAGPPMYVPVGCSCRTARLPVVGYQLKKVQEEYRYLGISHNSALSYDLWRKGRRARCSGSCWLNYTLLYTDKRQSRHTQKQLQLIHKILIWRSISILCTFVGYYY